MADEKQGIKELKEAIQGVMKLAAVMGELLRDGAQASDAIALAGRMMTDPAFRAALDAAYQGAHRIPAEAADLDLFESIEIAKIIVGEIPAVLASFRKA